MTAAHASPRIPRLMTRTARRTQRRAKALKSIKRLNLSQGSDTPSRNRQQSLRLAAIGIEFFSTILGLVVLGYFLDEYFHIKPLLGACGLLLGMVLGVYRLTVGLRRLD